MTWEEEKYLGRKIIKFNDPEARDLLVRSNLRLVVNIAKKFSNRGMSLGDLIEEGNLGLIKAVDYYDPDRGTRFSTYAAWWIKQSIKLALLNNVQPMHVPTYMVALINQWRRIAAELQNRLGRAPDIEEMADTMGLAFKKAKVIHQAVNVISSVKEAFVSNNPHENELLDDVLFNKNSNKPEDDLVADEERQKALRLLNKIDAREATILRMHYGLDGNDPLPLKTIGEKLGLTRERIRQIQRTALTKLYDYMNE